MVYIGACKYCGQICTADTEFDSQEEADNYATNQCNCERASTERALREAICFAYGNAAVLFGNPQEKAGITKEELIEELRRLTDGKAFNYDYEITHHEADDLLLAYINDEAVTEAFDAIPKWYA